MNQYISYSTPQHISTGTISAPPVFSPDFSSTERSRVLRNSELTTISPMVDKGKKKSMGVESTQITCISKVGKLLERIQNPFCSSKDCKGLLEVESFSALGYGGILKVEQVCSVCGNESVFYSGTPYTRPGTSKLSRQEHFIESDMVMYGF